MGEWDLQKSAGDCGLTISDAANNMQTATCAISFTAGANVNVGNSAFVYDANTIAGLDFSSEVSAVFTWDNEIVDISAWAATKDVNVTDTSIGDCFTSGNNRAGEMNNFAIGNYGASVTVQMNVACNNVESHAAEVTMVDTTTCSFVLDVTDSRAALLVFSADTQSNVDFFAVSVQ